MLNIVKELSDYIGKDTGLDKQYINLTILTILTFIFFSILKAIIKKDIFRTKC